MTQKIQYFMPDLAKHLGIGEIRDIHVATDNGKPVLRIEFEEMSVYKTIRANKQEKKQVVQKPEKEMTFSEKLASGAKDFFLNPERNKNKPW